MYSCSWPAYLIGQNPPYPEIQEACNLWRNYYDIADSWTSVNGIIQWYGDDEDQFAQYAAPGSWNDPDMVQFNC